MSYPNGGQPGQPQQPGQPGQPQQWGQPQTGSHQTWGQAAQAGFNNVKATSGFDAKNVRPGQWIALGLWVLTIIALSLNFIGGQSASSYGYSYDIPGASGWNGGMFVFMFILFLLAAASAAVEIFMPQVRLPFPLAFVTGGLLALGSVLGLIYWLTNLDSIEYWGVGAWIVLVVIVIGIVGAVLELMHGFKAPKTGGNVGGDQWGQPAAGGQWGQPAAGGQWGQPAAPQQQWNQPQQPQSGGFGAPPQTGGQPTHPPQQPGQPGQPGQGQWGNPQV